MPRHVRIGHELAELLHLRDGALPPRRVHHLGIIGHTVFVGVDLDRIAPHVRGEPRGHQQEVVEEAAVGHEPRVCDGLVGLLGLELRDLEFGDVDAECAGPDFDGLSGGVFEVVAFGKSGDRRSWLFHGVDAGQHEDVRVELAQLEDLFLLRRGPEEQVDARRLGRSLAEHSPPSPEIAHPGIGGIGLGQAAVLQLEHEGGVGIAAHEHAVDLHRIGRKPLERRTVIRRAVPRGKGRHRRIPAVRTHGVPARGGGVGLHGELDRGRARSEQGAGGRHVAGSEAVTHGRDGFGAGVIGDGAARESEGEDHEAGNRSHPGTSSSGDDSRERCRGPATLIRE